MEYYKGRKKDFWDLHELTLEFSLEEMLSLHEERYPYTHDRELIKTNFVNFDDADYFVDPVCLRGKYWEVIKMDLVEFVNS